MWLKGAARASCAAGPRSSRLGLHSNLALCSITMSIVYIVSIILIMFAYVCLIFGARVGALSFRACCVLKHARLKPPRLHNAPLGMKAVSRTDVKGIEHIESSH